MARYDQLTFDLVLPMIVALIAILMLPPDLFGEKLSLFPPILGIASLYLSYHFNRIFGFWLSLLLLGLWLMLHETRFVVLGNIERQILLLGLHLCVFIWSWQKERGLWTLPGLYRLIPFAFVVAAVWTLNDYSEGQLRQAWPAEWFTVNWGAYTSGFVVVLVGLMVFSYIGRYMFRPSPEIGFVIQLTFWLGLILIPVSKVDGRFSMDLVYSIVFASLMVSLFRHAHQIAYYDELTRIPGRRALNEKLDSLGPKYVIAMCDVDHFKKFNDTHGHDLGDQVLQMVATQLNRVNGGGLAYRYGGEEFTLLFPNKDIDDVLPFLEAVREKIAHYKVVVRSDKRPKSDRDGAKKRGSQQKVKTVNVTISIGVARKSRQLNNYEEVIKSADNLLYKAKKKGRNCVVAEKEK